MRPTIRTSAAVAAALLALAACHRRRGPYIAGSEATATAQARDVDALWMVTLPPVVVTAAAPNAHRPAAQTPTYQRHADNDRARTTTHD